MLFQKKIPFQQNNNLKNTAKTAWKKCPQEKRKEGPSQNLNLKPAKHFWRDLEMGEQK